MFVSIRFEPISASCSVPTLHLACAVSNSSGMRFLRYVLIGLGFFITARSQPIEVDGLSHQTVYADTVSFRIPELPGFLYRAALDGQPIPTGAITVVTAVDYHELTIQRKMIPDGIDVHQTWQFIVRSSQRAHSEWGLPPWTPYPVINGSPAEFEGASLRIMAPRAYPAGMELPIVAWVTNRFGQTVRANGVLAIGDGASIQLRRGVGSGFLSWSNVSGSRVIRLQLHQWHEDLELKSETNVVWTRVSGVLREDTFWPSNSRIDLTSNLSIPDGVLLEIGSGSVIRCAPNAEFQVEGIVRASGGLPAPVVFAPTDRALPWGGFVLRTNTARLILNHCVLWGGGAESNWFQLHPGSGVSHKPHRPVIYLAGKSRVTLNDCAILDSSGQATHGEDGRFNATRTLIQRHVTGGQHNRGSVTMNDCAVIEFPYDGAPFADDDNDALYLTGGSHSLTNCLLGWAGDDGLDAGSGSAGSVTVIGSWFESCFHEAMAWSETRTAVVRDSVCLNSGQGIEAGFGAPDVLADHVLCLGNGVGARFGDNYDWTYLGFLRVTNSLLLDNYRNIFGRTWTPNTWTNRLDRMDVRGNWLAPEDPVFPNNHLWVPATEGWRLSAFSPIPSGSDVGLGFLRHTTINGAAHELSPGLRIGLSHFSTNFVTVHYQMTPAVGESQAGTLTMDPGKITAAIPAVPMGSLEGLYRVELSEPGHAVIVGSKQLWIWPTLRPRELRVAVFQGAHYLLWSESEARLETSEDLNGPWAQVANTRPPVQIQSDRSQFFRLSQDDSALQNPITNAAETNSQ